MIKKGGLVDAMFNLVVLLSSGGSGVPVDLKRAKRHFQVREMTRALPEGGRKAWDLVRNLLFGAYVGWNL